MKRFSYIFLLCLSLALTSWGEGHATTWMVAKDGSGDYSVIQDALDVCAAGDTVRIDTGRYEELKVHTFAKGGTSAVIMIPTVSPLTILGSDRDSVFVGPAVLTTNLGGHQTACFGPDFSPPNGFEVNNVTFENTNLLVGIDVRATFSSCRFRFMGAEAFQVLSAPNLHVFNCEFESSDGVGYADGILGFEGGSNPGLIVRKCVFRKMSSCIAITGSTDFEISGCYFEDVAVAAGLQNHSTGVMRNCVVGPSLPGVARIVATLGSVVELDSLQLSPSSVQLRAEGTGTQINGRNLVLDGGTFYTIRSNTGGSLNLRSCVY